MSRSLLECRRGLHVLAVLGSGFVASAVFAGGLGSGGDPDRRPLAEQASRSWKLVQAEDSHAAHHPAASGSGGDGASQSNGAANPGSDRSSDPSSSGPGAGTMGEMMGRPRKEFYPSLMDMPALSPEQRRSLESWARGRIGAEIDGISAAEMDLRHAIAAGDVVAADQASGQIRYALDGVRSGVTVLRSLNEGKSPQQIAQNWFKAQMNLLPQLAVVDADGVLGISWFHVTTMALLAIFSSGMLAVYVARMRRANALVDRLTRAPVPAPVLQRRLRRAERTA